MSLDFSFSLEALEAAEAATANPYLKNPARGLHLLAQLTGQPRQHADQAQRQQPFAELHRLIHERFMDLAAQGSYPGEARALRELMTLEQSLESLAAFPGLASKTVVGLGGGFSAGKSRLVNTLLGADLLPEALEPTTAIPSFITRGQDGVVALNRFNRQVALDHDGLQAITHAFTRHYRDTLDETFGFAHVLKLLLLQHGDFAWNNLAFLDTPGYSKADALDASHRDEGIALRQLAEADHVMWLIRARDGTIRQDDLVFLHDLAHPRPIFFVVTQADLSSRSGIDTLLRSTAQAIEAAGIRSAGLMAWSAPLGCARGERVAGDDIHVWLDTLDRTSKYTGHRRTCEQVLDGYIGHDRQSLVASRQTLALFNTLLPLQDQLPTGERATLQERLKAERSQQATLADRISAFEALKDEMLAVIGEIVGSLAIDAPSLAELYEQGLALNEQGQFKAAAQCFEQAAQLGSAEAQWQFGVCQHKGQGVPMDVLSAVRWYRTAACQGHAAAQFHLALSHEEGAGVQEDWPQAVSWYFKAAGQEYAPAQYRLGLCLAEGKGITRDDQQAMRWFESAARLDHPQARFNVLTHSVEQGNTASMYALGVLYEQGLGVAQDLDQALSLYRQAADAGHADAQLEIGRRYLEGNGLRKNSAHATSWLEKAARQKNDDALALLKELHPHTYGNPMLGLLLNPWGSRL